jgi:hypothetical protein
VAPTALPIGLLLDGFQVPAWLYRSLELAVDRGDVAIAALVHRPEPPEPDPAGPAAWRLFTWLDEMLTRRRSRGGADPFQPRDVRSLAGTARVIEAPDTPEGLERVRECGLAALVHAGFGAPWGGHLAAGARFGTWVHRHGDPRRFRGGPAGLREYLGREPAIGAALVALDGPAGPGRPLGQANCTAFEAVTWGCLRRRIAWHASELLPKALHRLAREGEAGFAAMLAEQMRPLSVYDRPRYGPPGAGEALRALVLLAGHSLEVLGHRLVTRPLRRLRWIKYMEWAVLYRFGGTGDPGRHLDLNAFRMLRAPEGHFWADPFLAEDRGRLYLFMEDLSYATGKGVISVAELGADGLQGPPAVALEEPYHLSYPQVFQHEGVWYLLPETRQSGQIRLYRAEAFPTRWVLEAVLLDRVSAVDTTLVQHDGRWWMFACCANTGQGLDDGLHLYHADTLLGPWLPHPHNPVNQDTYSMRPAGHCFRRDGRLYRPAQISIEYGWGMTLVEITELTRERYAERVVETIEPLWRADIKGLHTLNMAGGCMVVDGKLHRG